MALDSLTTVAVGGAEAYQINNARFDVEGLFQIASAGLAVRVLERRSVVGGAAVTEEFFPGFRNSSASYTVSLLNPVVIRDLRLAQRGLRIVERRGLDDGWAVTKSSRTWTPGEWAKSIRQETPG